MVYRWDKISLGAFAHSIFGKRKSKKNEEILDKKEKFQVIIKPEQSTDKRKMCRYTFGALYNCRGPGERQ